nr:reverse transcriptase domain-containing protein [Tanacetum cinerariifolium]
MCIDFKDLNKACPEDLYTFPEMDQKIESLMGFKYKFFLDAYKGYHRIQMATKDEEKTAFHTDEGVFCYTKIPFGLKNVRAMYQRLVDNILKGQIGRNLEGYVDDIVIKSKTELEMIKDVKETLLMLKKVTMKLNPKECSFRMEEGKILGYIVTFEGIRANPEKQSAIKGQVLTNFLADTMAEDNFAQTKPDGPNDTLTEGENLEEQEATKTQASANPKARTDIWKLYPDGASYDHRSGVGLILIDPKGAEYSYALRLNFANLNNDMEYEAL